MSGLTNRRQMRDIWGDRDRFLVGRRRWRPLGARRHGWDHGPAAAHSAAEADFERISSQICVFLHADTAAPEREAKFEPPKLGFRFSAVTCCKKRMESAYFTNTCVKKPKWPGRGTSMFAPGSGGKPISAISCKITRILSKIRKMRPLASIKKLHHKLAKFISLSRLELQILRN